ncbi:hypothetical protein [Xenorhabdus sp. KJ12.1]|uniref:hypothetical protein n=1 Tax=Xenorhabdus sp. KJ12.1 TaxID=1851571 RepID=UPI000C0476E0|nr:hypothetical protein [Xenorhabdus sp. KJ12.1]PHM69545.1 hypothetical protein Xekj_02514 [Xenorhabdus sp. KJ12.1]
MITSLITKDLKITPTELAKEIINLYGRDGLGRVRSILANSEISVTERELEIVYGHCLTIYSRICKYLNQAIIEIDVLKTVYPLEKV